VPVSSAEDRSEDCGGDDPVACESGGAIPAEPDAVSPSVPGIAGRMPLDVDKEAYASSAETRSAVCGGDKPTMSKSSEATQVARSEAVTEVPGGAGRAVSPRDSSDSGGEGHVLLRDAESHLVGPHEEIGWLDPISDRLPCIVVAEGWPGWT